MKSIMMSIKPKWVAKILNREKTIEVRKQFPVDYVGWVYIYCTKEDNLCCIRKISRDRYICGKDFDIRDFPNLSSGYDGKGKVVARFWCDKVGNIEYQGFGGFAINMPSHIYTSFVDKFYSLGDLLRTSRLPYNELHNYLKGKNGYAIHITKLEIFETPREISDFHKIVNIKKCDTRYCDDLYSCLTCEKSKLNKAPQSWCYIGGEQ